MLVTAVSIQFGKFGVHLCSGVCLLAFLSVRKLMLLSMVSCLYPLFFIFPTCFSLCIWNVASLESKISFDGTMARSRGVGR